MFLLSPPGGRCISFAMHMCQTQGRRSHVCGKHRKSPQLFRGSRQLERGGNNELHGAKNDLGSDSRAVHTFIHVHFRARVEWGGGGWNGIVMTTHATKATKAKKNVAGRSLQTFFEPTVGRVQRMPTAAVSLALHPRSFEPYDCLN